jgi:nucleosome assembly protein 1-like 1
MSEAETPIDHNTTGGEPVPNEENESPLAENAFAGLNLGNNNNNEEDDHDDEVDHEDDDEEDEDEEDEDFMAELPQSVRHRVEKMKELNHHRDEIMDDYLKERAALEKKYSDLCKPLYAQRAEIIVGKKDKEIASQTINSDNADAGEEADDEDELVGVPEFWSCCIHNIEAISELVTERDNDCLLYLENVTCDDFDDGKGFELKFYFKEDNPYFTNKILTKKYEIPNLLLDDEPILKNVSGCDIQWKPDMCLTFRDVTKKQRSKSGKKAGQIRTVTKKERSESFFHFFR